MNVAYHSSDLFAPVLGTSIVSLLENNKSFDSIDIYVIENKISSENKRKLQSMVESYNRNISFIPMHDVNEEENLGLKKIKDNWLFDSYCRMFLDKYLPESVERVLYLDSDVLIVDDLTELWSTDLDGKPVGTVKDCVSKEYFELFGLGEDTYYCNSGVILFDLNLWNKMNIGNKVRDYVKKNNGYVFFMEQSVLNVCLQHKMYALPVRYNTMTMINAMSYDEIVTLRKPYNYYTQKEVEKAKNKPAILHMITFFLITNRAWFANTNHPVKDIYRKYYAMTPWKDTPLFEDKRTAKKKITQAIVDHIPRKILLPIVSFVYNYPRIWKIRGDMKKYAKL